MKRWGVTLIIAALAAGCLIGCKDKEEDTSSIVVVSPHPNGFIKPLIHEFENSTGIEVRMIECGTADAIDKVAEDDDVDIMWGGSVLTVGPFSDLFYQYETPNEKYFKDEYKASDIACTFFSDVPSVIIINNDMIGGKKIKGYADLLDSDLVGKIAFANPAKSSSSFEHLVNMLYAMGGGDPEKGWDYVGKFTKSLSGNLLDSSSMVYEGVANGRYAVGLTFEEAAVTMLKSDKHVSIIYMDEGVVSTPDGIYINKNSKKIDKCKKFVDFMTDRNTQIYIAQTLGRRSVRIDVEASGLVLPKNDINNITVDKKTVTENKDKWIAKFKDIYEEGIDG
ncbi:MAG: extracellular solute-binding protein [Butyrivibrio sp.]|nr:extracellular solute-binding protein [Butyrivibrio sp.]